jgi:hypothetical protein
MKSRAPRRVCQSYLNAGDELASETVTHPYLTKLTPEQVNQELSVSKNWIEQRFGPCPDFMIPYDDYNDSVIAAVKNYYKAARSSDPGFNTTTSLYYYDVLVQVIYNTTTAVQVQKWVQTAIDNRSWIVLEYHDVDNSGSQYSVTPAVPHCLLCRFSAGSYTSRDRGCLRPFTNTSSGRRSSHR